MNEKLNLAIIGIGRWGKNLTDTFSKQNVNIKYCFHNGSAENTKWINEKCPNIILAKNYEEILEDKTVDTIVIATPIKTHFELAKKALEAKKNVFIEKPGTQTIEEFEELKKIQKENDSIVTIGYVFIHHPICNYINKILKDEKITSIHFEWNKWGSFGEDIIENLVTHEISILKYFGIDIDTKTLSITNHPHITKSDIFVLEANSTQGVNVSININRVSQEKRKSITIKTDKNSYIWTNNELKKINTNQNCDNIEVNNTTALDMEISNFINDIKNHTNPLVDIDFSIDILKTISFLKDSKHL
jgi:predicted dehydrogenase